MKKIQDEILQLLQKVHDENHMPESIKIIPLEIKDNSTINFDITMSLEECKNWSYIFIDDEQLNYEGLVKGFSYNKELKILHLIYRCIGITSIHNSEWH